MRQHIMKTVKTIFLLLAIMIMSCTAEPPTPTPDLELVTADLVTITNMAPYLATSPITITGALYYKDVPYGASGTRQKFDIYVPTAVGEDSPVIVYFHGGSYQSGDKGDFLVASNQSEIQEYIDENMAFVTSNYTFIQSSNADGLGVYTSLEDGPKLYEQLTSIQNLSSMNLNMSRTAVAGGSSGAGMAQFLAYSKYGPVIKAISLDALQATNDILKYDDIFQPTWPTFDIVTEATNAGLLTTLVNFHGGAVIGDLTSDPNIVGVRAKVEYLSPGTLDSYNGAMRIVAGNVGVAFGPPTSYTEIVHHQLHAIATYNNAVANSNSVIAEIPHLNLTCSPRYKFIIGELAL